MGSSPIFSLTHKMLPCLVFLISLGAVWGLPVPKMYPIGHPSTGRVIGGQESIPNEWKWQVSVQIAYKDSPDAFGHICGGTIFTSHWIMTAAHCISFPEDNLYRVAFGEHNLDVVEGTEYYLDVAKIIVHENWNPNYITDGFDIALLRLASTVYDNSYVEIAREPGPNEILPNGYSCTITGWGSTGSSYPSKLQQAEMSVVDYATCSQPDWWSTAVSDQMICTGGDGVIAGCFGDSGGPLNCFTSGGYWAVYGIVSFGPSTCNEYKKPTVFTRVSAYLDWMHQTMDANGGE